MVANVVYCNEYLRQQYFFLYLAEYIITHIILTFFFDTDPFIFLYNFCKIQVLHVGGITSLRTGLAETYEDSELDAGRACAQGQGGSSAPVARMSTACTHAARAPSLTQGLRGGKTRLLIYYISHNLCGCLSLSDAKTALQVMIKFGGFIFYPELAKRVGTFQPKVNK